MASAMLLKVVRRVWISCTLVLAGEAHVVLAAGQLVGGGAHVLDGLQHLLAHAAHARSASSTVAVMPMMAATIQLRRRWRASVTWRPVRRSTRALRAAMAMALPARARCILPMDQADGQRLVGLAFRHEGAGHRVVEALGGGKGDLLEGLDGFGFEAHRSGRQLGLLETEGPHARPDRLPRALAAGT